VVTPRPMSMSFVAPRGMLALCREGGREGAVLCRKGGCSMKACQYCVGREEQCEGMSVLCREGECSVKACVGRERGYRSAVFPTQRNGSEQHP
jgi:hypothetical protein